MTRTRKTILIVVGAILVLAVAGIIWFATAQGTQQDAEPTPVVSASVPPTPSVFPTPTPGSTDVEPPASAPIETDIDDVATVVEGVTAEVVSMTAFESSSEQPGDLAGPALKVVVRVTNSTDAPLDLGGATVNLAYGPDLSPAPPLGDTVATGLPATLAAGESADGEYSFSIPVDARSDVGVTVDLLTGEPYVAFRGAAPAS